MNQRTIAAVAALTLLGVSPVIADVCGGPPPLAVPTFSEPVLLDEDLAGGEPSIQPLADGSLLYSAHAGTTHLYKPVGVSPQDPTGWTRTYDGTVNTWISRDEGTSWTPSPLLEQTTGLALPEGFSDPSTAVDRAGNVYLSAIDAATTYVGRSADGASFVGNKLSTGSMDREWIAADMDGIVYMIATPFLTPWPGFRSEAPLDVISDRVLWRSETGGASWDDPLGIELDGGGSMSPIAVNPIDGSLAWPATEYFQGFGPTDVYVWPKARNGDLKAVRASRIIEPLPHIGGFFNPSVFDDAGNYYVAWNGYDDVGIARSTDGGRTFDHTTVYDASGKVMWPWVAAGANGRVALAWLEANGQGEWRVMVGVTRTANGWIDGCGKNRPPHWVVTRVTDEPIHTGYICEAGLSCNSDPSTRGDRRLGDYFTIAITPEGRLVVAYGDTAHHPGDAVSHPAFVKQLSGIDLR